MNDADRILVALMKLDANARMAVLELLPEWQRLTKTNDLRTTVRREVLDTMIDVIVEAQKHYSADGDPLNSLVKIARGQSAKLRIAEREAKEKP